MGAALLELIRRALPPGLPPDICEDVQQEMIIAALCGEFDLSQAARLHVEAMKASRQVDPFTFAGAAMQLATIQAIEGDHAGSLHRFQSIGPMVRAVARLQPYLWPLYCNALAVELSELGRIDEARAASAVAVASPIANAYPEWQETAAELRQTETAHVSVVIKRQEARGEGAEPIIHHSSFIIHHSTPAAGPRLRMRPVIIKSRASPRASPRAPPVVFEVLTVK